MSAPSPLRHGMFRMHRGPSPPQVRHYYLAQSVSR